MHKEIYEQERNSRLRWFKEGKDFYEHAAHFSERFLCIILSAVDA